MQSLAPKHIIISRTDNIGDVVLTLPMAALIKQAWPDCKVTFLARDYVKSVALNCADVDDFISWDELQQLPEQQAAKNLADADTIIHVYPRKKIAKLAKLAKIKHRIGTSHRFYHWLSCTKKVNFTRKNSEKHEAQLNLELLAPLDLPTTFTLPELVNLTHMHVPHHSTTTIQQFLADDKFNLILHPLSNGNSKEWPLENFSKLITLLPADKFNILLTGTPNEQQRLQTLIDAHPEINNLVGKLSLDDFMVLLATGDGLVVNSTGPLHIAAALGKQVLGLFPSDKGKDPERWGPLGKQASYLVAPLCNACKQRQQESCNCMSAITPEQVKSVIESWN
jgi:ADP-heptose:LPS heptosyltransferase